MSGAVPPPTPSGILRVGSTTLLPAPTMPNGPDAWPFVGKATPFLPGSPVAGTEPARSQFAPPTAENFAAHAPAPTAAAASTVLLPRATQPPGLASEPPLVGPTGPVVPLMPGGRGVAPPGPPPAGTETVTPSGVTPGAPVVPPPTPVAPVTPGGGGPVPPVTPTSPPDVKPAPAGGTVTPGPIPTPAPVPVTPPTAKPLVLRGPLIADAVAEDLLPVQLPKDAVKLYHVNLVPVDRQPPGLQPMWAMKVADGRFWPVGLPTPFGLWAGDKPAVSPSDLLLYADHIDGIAPLYEVSRQEARVMAVRDNDAAVLSTGRDIYDIRRKAWQAPAARWQWTWFVRQLDVEPGDTVVACLTDLKRSRRVPADFTPAAEETLFLLDEAGNRVAPGEVDSKALSQIAEPLDPAAKGLSTADVTAFRAGIKAKGVVGLASWLVPTKGRYQIWAALNFDKSAATCKTWTTAAGP